jgi:precorrin-4/cobalt-precorrin-4 C11-methyltransferase
MGEARVTRTAVVIVGDVLAADGTDSYLYSASRIRRGRH